ncbi:MAG: ketoacyl-ACP synthase III [Alphaproteobacteria bacterium]|nr:ketoacyl-ACP synthase III [Alphaproteobacteria bacterium]
MTVAFFNHTRICGIKTVLPEHFIDIDDELQYFDNNPKKLARAKKMMGYGRRYIADERTTVTDMAVYAAEKLLLEMKIDRNDIDLLIFVNQKPDYPEPCDACVAHGKLKLNKNCTSLDINLGCSGYVHGLLTAHALMSSGAYKTCLLLVGDLCARTTDQTNRKGAPVFGDAASATVLTYTSEERNAYFVTGTDGTGWNKIVHPLGGMRLPLDKDTIDLYAEDTIGNRVLLHKGIMKGEDVFNFTMDVAPALLKDTMKAANWTADDVDLFAIHQANKQIVENIIAKAEIPPEKAPVDVFSKYANNSTNSVVTVLCDQTNPLKNVVLCAFGIGLSWGGAALDLSGLYNGGIAHYVTPQDAPSRERQIKYWINFFKGEEE